MSKTIYLDAPNIGAPEKRYLNKAIDSGYVSTVGPFVSEFERMVAKYLHVRYAVSTQSGTAALHMALYELGIGRGDEVIVPVLTFAATVNPVTYVRAKPVFVDVDIRTFNIDTKEIEKKITKKTKAIIPVHLYGNPCDMDGIMRIAREYNLHVIEDATESLGATYRNRFTGTFGDFGCLSFNGNKTITTGGGGMIVGKNAKKAAHIKYLINQARRADGGCYHHEIGFNYRMTNIEAALGLAQMEKLDYFVEKKKEFNRIYREELGQYKNVRFQETYEGAESSSWLTCIILDGKMDITRLQAELKLEGIPTRRAFVPLVDLPPYKASKGNFRNASYIYEKGLCLPSSTLNSRADILHVCSVMKKLIAA